jgi:hypothetical protein
MGTSHGSIEPPRSNGREGEDGWQQRARANLTPQGAQKREEESTWVIFTYGLNTATFSSLA